MRYTLTNPANLLDRVVGDFFNADLINGRNDRTELTPKVDILRNEKEYLVKVELPADVKAKVKVDGDQLTITGERKVEEKQENTEYLLQERYYGTFKRAFTIPKGTNIEGITANNQNGELTIIIPREVKQEREVNVNYH